MEPVAWPEKAAPPPELAGRPAKELAVLEEGLLLGVEGVSEGFQPAEGPGAECLAAVALDPVLASHP